MSGIMSVVSAAGGSGGEKAAETGSTANNVSKSGSNVAQNSSLVGGALDGLGMNVMSWFDRVQQMRNREQEQENFDKQFEENSRRFGLTFALQEWSTRKGMSLEEAQIKYNQTLSSRKSQTDLEKSRTQSQIDKMNLDRAKLQQKASFGFMKGFGNAQRSKKAWTTAK